jgi:hypothetical protein
MQGDQAMSVYADDDAADVYNETIRKARKEHRCDACSGSIKPGAIYSYTAALFDGGWQTATRCGRCETIYRHLEQKMRGNYEEYPHWHLDCGHGYRDRWDEEPPPEIAALAFLTDEEAGRLLVKP